MLAHNTIYLSLPVKNLSESIDFYRNKLGLNMVDKNETGVWFQFGQSRFAVFESKFAGTNKGTAAILEVHNPSATVKSLQARGITFEKYDIPGIKRRGVIHYYPSYEAAWFKDPSGNIICVTHHL